MIDCIEPLFLPYMEKLINQKKKYVKFINKINIFTINKAQNKSFSQGPKFFKTALLNKNKNRARCKHSKDLMLVLGCAEQKSIASPGRGILAIDESNATCGKRLASIGLENTEANRQAYRTLLVSAPGLGQYISGAILFEETLYQSTTDGKKIVDVLVEQNIVPGIKVDEVSAQLIQLTKGFDQDLIILFLAFDCVLY